MQTSADRDRARALAARFLDERPDLEGRAALLRTTPQRGWKAVLSPLVRDFVPWLARRRHEMRGLTLDGVLWGLVGELTRRSGLEVRCEREEARRGTMQA